MFNFLNKIQDLFIKIKFKRIFKQRFKAYNKFHQTPYGVPTRNSGYYE